MKFTTGGGVLVKGGKPARRDAIENRTTLASQLIPSSNENRSRSSDDHGPGHRSEVAVQVWDSAGVRLCSAG